MSEESSAADSVQADVPDATVQFMEVYDCAKNNHDWIKVKNAVANHPEWLTRVPQGRRWTMLHQIVFNGNVTHLNEILAYQIANDDFGLLFKALDGKTIRDVAIERGYLFPQMVTCVERLITSDQMLGYAKEQQWDLVRVTVQQHPSVVNAKPPFRESHLIHLLALAGRLDLLIELNSVQPFKLQVLSNGKTADAIARENNHLDFAEHIEHLRSTTNEPVDEMNDQPDEPTDHENHSHPPAFVLYASSMQELTDMLQMHNQVQPVAPPPPPTVQQENSAPVPWEDDDDANQKYEQIVVDNAKDFPMNTILETLMCPITNYIFRDPVIAADGITYERSAITRWFQNSHRSPSTNQDLDTLRLIPNLAVKSIVQALHRGTSVNEISNSNEAASSDSPKTLH